MEIFRDSVQGNVSMAVTHAMVTTQAVSYVTGHAHHYLTLLC